jgi:hypothetical protein
MKAEKEEKRKREKMDNIRSPIPQYRDRLIDDDSALERVLLVSNEERELREVMEMSLKEIRDELSEEEVLASLLSYKREVRQREFDKIRDKLKPLMRIDSELKNIWNFIEDTILPSYISCERDKYVLTKDEHIQIFKILGNIRTLKEDIPKLQAIMTCEI